MAEVSIEEQKELASRLLSKLDETALNCLCDWLVGKGFVQVTHPRVVHAAPAPPLPPVPSGLPSDPYLHTYDYAAMVAEFTAAQLVQDFHASSHHFAPPAIPHSTAQGKPPRHISLSERVVAPSQLLAEAANKNADVCKKTDEFDPTITSLIIRNLNPSLTQEGMQDWLDAKGYKDMFDFVLWFPAKKTGRLNLFPYAFVNFITPELAHAFRSSYHGSVSVEKKDLTEKDVPLSIAPAKVQGFVNQFVRFGYLMTDSAKTQCKPYFSPSALEKHIAPEHCRLAEEQAARSPDGSEPLLEGQITTVVIRNLLPRLQDQAAAMEWFDQQGCGEYDFLLFFPGKVRSKKQPEQGSSMTKSDDIQGLGYMFVNFSTAEAAQDCTDKLNDITPEGGTAALSVVAARRQGREALVGHFGDIASASSGRVTPWV